MGVGSISIGVWIGIGGGKEEESQVAQDLIDSGLGDSTLGLGGGDDLCLGDLGLSGAGGVGRFCSCGGSEYSHFGAGFSLLETTGGCTGRGSSCLGTNAVGTEGVSVFTGRGILGFQVGCFGIAPRGLVGGPTGGACDGTA
jgi:hypothetical protein